jgi:hypothetical protein
MANGFGANTILKFLNFVGGNMKRINSHWPILRCRILQLAPNFLLCIIHVCYVNLGSILIEFVLKVTS